MTDNGAELLELCHEKYFDDPVGFANDILGIDLSEQQEEVAEALVQYRKVVVKSGHKVLCPCQVIGS